MNKASKTIDKNEVLNLQSHLIDLSLDAFFAWELSGNIVYWSNGAQNLYGYSIEEAMSHNGFSLLKTKFTCTNDNILSILEKKDSWIGEARQTAKDSSIFKVNCRLQLILDEAGRKIVIETDCDFTNHIQKDNELLKTEIKLNVALELADAGMWHFDLKKNRRFWSPKMYEMYGIEFTRSMTADLKELPILKEDIENLESILNKAYKEHTENISSEFRISHPNKGEVWIKSVGKIFYDKNGDPFEVIGINTDITESKRNYDLALETQTKLKTSLESMLDAVFISDVNGRFIEFNEAFATFHRFKSKDECLKTLVEYPDVLEVYTSDGNLAPLDGWAVPRALRGEKRSNEEYILKRKDTGDTWVGSYSFCPIRNEEGTIVGSIVIGRDITDQKRLEEELIKSYKINSEILESISDGFFYLNKEWKFIYINKRAAGNMGYEPTDLLDVNIWDKFSHFKDTEIQKNFHYVMRERENVEFELIGILKDRHYQFNVYPTSEGISVFMLDITKRKKTEASLEISNQKINEILSSIQDDFYVLDYNWEFVFANKQFTSKIGKEPKDFLGNNIWEMFPKHIGTEYEENVRAAMEKREMRRFDVSGKYTDKYYKMSVFPSKDGITVLGIDISEQKKLENELVIATNSALEANKAKGQFLANMSHEIRTPMNGIMGIAQLLTLSNLSIEQRDMVNTINFSSLRLLNIINDILELSKIDAGKVELHTEIVDVFDLMKEKSNLLASLTKNKELDFEVEIDDTVPKQIIVDRTRLQQVTTNLIGNAIKFTEKGKISVRVKKVKDFDNKVKLMFTISDTGIGIREEEIPKLFNYFSQIDNTVTKKFQGTGLGLAISKSLVELMGGEIGVISEFGKGSSFYFTCLADIPSNLAQSHKNIGLTIDTPKLKLKLLLVEDDAVSQLIVKHLCKMLGWEFEIASNGIEALAILEQRNFDIILMDIQMPEMSGFEVTRLIREKEKSSKTHTPIIATTAYAMSGDEERCLNSGMDDYISKPIDLEKFKETIEKWINIA